MLHEQLTHDILGCCFEVHNEIGIGYPEAAYQAGLEAALASAGIPFEAQVALPVFAEGVKAHTFRTDFVVKNLIILELKSLESDFARNDFIQLYSYLKAKPARLGFLFNFGLERVVSERVIFDEKPVQIRENWRYLGEAQRESVDDLRTALIDTAGDHGLGYGAETCRDLVRTMCRPRGMKLECAPMATAYFGEQPLGSHELRCTVIDDRIVCTITALRDSVDSYQIARNQSYLWSTGLPIGVHVNYGKETLHIHGVRAPK